MKKKILSIILTFAMVLSMLSPTTALAGRAGASAPYIVMNTGSVTAHYTKFDETLGETVSCEITLDPPTCFD